MLQVAARRVIRCDYRSATTLRRNGQNRETRMRAYWTYSARGWERVPGAKSMKNLCLAHHVLRLSRILRPLVGFEEAHIRGCLALSASVEEFPFLMWEQVWKVLHSWRKFDDAVEVE